MTDTPSIDLELRPPVVVDPRAFAGRDLTIASNPAPRQGPFATTLLAYDATVAAVTAGDPITGTVLGALVQLSHFATARALAPEIPFIVREIAAALELTEDRRRALAGAFERGLETGVDPDQAGLQLANGIAALRERGDDPLDPDALDRKTIRGFLRGVTTPAGTSGSQPIGPQLADYDGAVDPASTPTRDRPNPRWAELGALEKKSVLRVGVEQEFPYFCVTRHDRSAFTGLDEVFATDDPFVGGPLKSLKTSRNSVRTSTPVQGDPNAPSGSYLVDIVGDRPRTHTKEFRFGRNVATYQCTLVEYGGIGDPDGGLNKLVQSARQTLKDNQSDLKDKAKAAAAAAVAAAVPQGGSLASGLAEGLVEALVDFGIKLALDLSDLGLPFPSVVGNLQSIYAVGGPPLMIASLALLSGDVDQPTATPLALSRVAPMPGGGIQILDPSSQETEQTTRWWLGASLPAEPIGSSLGAFAGAAATAWRNARAVTDDATRQALQSQGVIVSGAAGGTGFAFRGLGGIVRLRLPGDEATYMVAVRLDSRLVDGSDEGIA